MKIRPGDLRDAEAIGALWFESWKAGNPSDSAVTKADLMKRAARELAGRWKVTIAEVNDKLVGFLAIAPAEQRLDQIFVAPSKQRHGIGAELLKIAKQRLPDGFWLKADATNDRARKFYERHGLTFTRAESENGRERVIYRFEP